MGVEVFASEAAEPGELFTRLFEESGGATNMNVDGSSTPIDFDIIPPPGRGIVLDSLHFVLQGTNFKPSLFGGLTALTNGVALQVVEGITIIVDFANSFRIKTNADFSLFSEGIIQTFGAGADDMLKATFDFQLSGRLVLVKGTQKARIKIQDDLTGAALDRFECMARGYLIPLD